MRIANNKWSVLYVIYHKSKVCNIFGNNIGNWAVLQISSASK